MKFFKNIFFYFFLLFSFSFYIKAINSKTIIFKSKTFIFRIITIN